MFRGLTIYQLTQPTDAVQERLLDSLADARHRFTPCGQHDARSHGFVQPLGPDTDAMDYQAEGALLFCLRTDEKVVPAAAVKEQVSAMVRAKQAEGEEVSKTDQRIMKEEVIEQLLPGAIPAPSWTYAYIDRSLGMLFVGAGEDGADSFVQTMKVYLGGTPFSLLALNDVDPCAKFTEWLKDPAALGKPFALGDACSLKQSKEGGTEVHNISHGDLEAEDLHALLTAGKECCRIALEHEDVHFAINAKLGLRRLMLSDGRKADLDEDDNGEPSRARSNEFAMWVVVVRTIMRELEGLLGGWPTQEMLDLKSGTEAA